jgi:cytochrome c oxidase cbb3-type subunit 3
MRIFILIILCITASLNHAASTQSLSDLVAAYSVVVDTKDEAGFPVLIQESNHSYEKTLENVRRSIDGSNFKLIREQLLVEGFELAQTSAQRETIIYFCNFSKVDRVLRIDKRVGQFLPCRVTVVEQNGKVYVMAINPKYFSRLFANEKLVPVCDEITTMYKQIISESTF